MSQSIGTPWNTKTSGKVSFFRFTPLLLPPSPTPFPSLFSCPLCKPLSQPSFSFWPLRLNSWNLQTYRFFPCSYPQSRIFSEMSLEQFFFFNSLFDFYVKIYFSSILIDSKYRYMSYQSFLAFIRTVPLIYNHVRIFFTTCHDIVLASYVLGLIHTAPISWTLTRSLPLPAPLCKALLLLLLLCLPLLLAIKWQSQNRRINRGTNNILRGNALHIIQGDSYGHNWNFCQTYTLPFCSTLFTCFKTFFIESAHRADSI